MFDYSKASGLGTDTIERSVLGPPFINIIQKGSPEFDETHKDFASKKIDGCRPGNILFEPERLILTQPLEIIPLGQTATYVGWKPNKGGFAGNFPLTVTGDRGYRKGTPGTPTEYKEYLNELELNYTITFIVLFNKGGTWTKGIIAFAATQLKVARQWSKAILGVKFPDMPNVTPPIFAAKYHLSTFADSNGKGGFFSWKIANAGLLSPEADQALLETAFDASKEAQLMLPRPLSQAALPAPVEVLADATPY